MIPFFNDHRSNEGRLVHLQGSQRELMRNLQSRFEVSIDLVSPPISRIGMGSKVSSWLGPPCSHNMMIDLAGVPEGGLSPTPERVVQRPKSSG